MFFKRKPSMEKMATMVNMNLIIALAIKMGLTPREFLELNQDSQKINEFMDTMNKLMLEKRV